MSTQTRIRVAVSGFRGRMGAEVVQAVSSAPDMEFVGGADPAWDGSAKPGVLLSKNLEDVLQGCAPDVVVDFTTPSTVFANAERVLQHGTHCVVGTTGLTPEERTRLGNLAAEREVGILIAPNFAVGAVLMMEFARQAARWFAGAEIVELHHDRKLDAPSGTSLMTAENINAARQTPEAVSGGQQPARGQQEGSVHIHSVRLPGLVAHQEVLFGNPGETLTIRHDSLDRKGFMPGVLMGIRRIRERRGLVSGLESFLSR